MRPSKPFFAIFSLIGLLLLTAFAQPTHAQQPATVIYIVQPGDNLYRIGLKFNVTPDVIARANGILNPNVVVLGQRLVIPVGIIAPPPVGTADVGRGTPPATGTMAATAPAVGTPLPPITPIAPSGTYTVQRGDNLYRIALRFNTTIFVLGQLNGLVNLNLVYVGQVLRLPGGQASQPNIASTPDVGTFSQPGTSTPSATSTPIPADTSNTGGAIITTPVPILGNVGFAVGVEVSNSQAPGDLAKSAADLGATWVKVVANWKLIEKTKGTLDYAALDAAINAYSAAGLKVLVTLTNAPDWARSTQNEDGPPNDLKIFSTFVTDIATRYKTKVQAYEVWNEPNLRRNWNGRQLGGGSYIELLRLAYAAIKSSDSAALVISAGLAPTGFNDGVNAVDDRTFLKQVYAAGLTAFSDAVGAHPNGWANPPDSTCCQASPGVTGWFNSRSFYFRDTLTDYRQIMKDNRDNSKFLWITAFGWGSADGVADESSVNENKFGFVKFTSQAKQAQYLTRGFEIGRDLAYVGPMFAYNLNACQASSGATDDEFYPCYYSLLDKTGKPRPAFDAIKALKK